ncbi:V-type proton ATPase subunit E-like protein, partial [Trifolium pratense]
SEYSMQLNASRIKVLQAQDDIVNSMKEVAAKELLKVSHHHLVEDILILNFL